MHFFILHLYQIINMSYYVNFFDCYLRTVGYSSELYNKIVQKAATAKPLPSTATTVRATH